VDIHPGDRASECGGMMRPTAIDMNHGTCVVVQRCETCGHERPNKIVENDNFDMVLRISRGEST
jgi:hypothetical protein